MTPARPPFSSFKRLTRSSHVLNDLLFEEGMNADHLLVVVEVAQLSNSCLMDHFFCLVSIKSKKDGPEELPLRNVIVFIVREVFLEVLMSMADAIVKVLDWGLGIVFDGHCVGVHIADVLTVIGLTYLLPWMICFIKRTVQC